MTWNETRQQIKLSSTQRIGQNLKIVMIFISVLFKLTNVHPATQTRMRPLSPRGQVRGSDREWPATGSASMCKWSVYSGAVIYTNEKQVPRAQHLPVSHQWLLPSSCPWPPLALEYRTGYQDTWVEVQQRRVGEGLVLPCVPTQLIKMTLHAGAICPASCGWDSRHF